MKKYSRSLAILMVCIFMSAILFAGCSSSSGTGTNTATQKPNGAQAPANQIVLRLGHEMPEDHPYHYGVTQFAKLVAEKTNNAVKVEVYPNGTIGKQADLTQGVSMGTIDCALVFSIILEQYSPDFGVLTLPYCFSSWDHAWKVLDGPIGDELNKTVENKGIKVLSYMMNGLANVNTVKPVMTPQDIKGIKLRVQEGPSYVALGKALGTVTTPMAFSEVYTALQLHTIDGQLQTVQNIKSNKFYEVAKYYTQINMCYNTQPLIMSKSVFDKLTPEYQKAVMEAAKEAAKMERDYHLKGEEADMQECVKNGLKVYTLTDAQLAQWHDAVQPVFKEFPQLMDRYNKIQQAK